MAELHSIFGSSGPAPFSGIKKKPAHHWYDELSDNAITGFLGNLSDDVIHTTMGIPAGILEMATSNPLHTAEKLAKATWQDWSPLFHGDVRTWAHNTYEHPLAPILDVASVLTGGAALSAKGAGLAAKVAEKAAASDVERLAARTGRAARYSNPRKAAYAGHEAKVLAERATRFGAGTTKHIQEAASEAARRTAHDPAAYHQVKGEIMTAPAKAVSNNPLNRSLQRIIDKHGPGGTDAAYKRWSKMDKGGRAAATTNELLKQIRGFSKAGKILSGMSPREYLETLHPGMHDAMIKQAHDVDITDIVKAKGGLDEAAWRNVLHRLSNDGYQPAKAGEHVKMEDVLHGLGTKASGESMKELEGALKKWGSHVTTDVRDDALFVKHNGRTYLKAVAKSDTKKTIREAANSSKVMKALYHNPTKVWKYMVLGASPRYFVNNLVGNSFMLLMSADPVNLSKAMYHHVAEWKGVRAADRAALETDLAAAGPTATADELAKIRAFHVAKTKVRGSTTNAQWVGGEFAGWGTELARPAEGKAGKLTEKALKAPGVRHAKAAMDLNFHLTHQFSDVFHRNVISNFEMNRAPEFQAMLGHFEKQGLKGWQARREASQATMQSSAAVRQQIRTAVRHTLGQYHTFDRWETGVKNVIPFYSWSRAISRHSLTLATTSTAEAKMLQAIGTEGSKHSAGLLGQVPEFMESAIPVKEFQKLPGGHALGGLLQAIGGGGDNAMMLTSGLNPYASLGDLTKAIKGTVGGTPRVGDSVGGQINPVLKGAIETITGTSMVSGAPIKPIGGLGNIYIGQGMNVPPAKLAEQLLGMTEKNNAKLFQQSNEQALASYFGLPTRNVNKKKAMDLYRRQKGLSGSSPFSPWSGAPSAAANGLPGL